MDRLAKSVRLEIRCTLLGLIASIRMEFLRVVELPVTIMSATTLVSNDQHPNHQLWINGWPAGVTVELG